MTSLPTLALISFLPLLLYVTHAGAPLRGYMSLSSTRSPSPSSDEGGVSRASVISKVDQNNNPSASSQQGFLNTDTDTIPKPQDSSISHTIGNTSNSDNTSNITTDTSTKRSKSPAHIRDSSGEVGSMCAYRLLEQGGTGRLCFRQTQRHLTCPSPDCQRVKSPGGSLTANVFTNGSVLIQWTAQDTWLPDLEAKGTALVEPEEEGASVTATQPSVSEWGGRRRRSGGYKLSCWWNGSYTQFECTGVHLGSSCRDYLLNELHENVPYRLCLQPLVTVGQQPGISGDDCVQFSVSATGMQDIVIAMTTVGGAICVMLVIICLLVAYITENIMSPTSHTHMSHTHH
ncbi:hypothetical protein ACEWY4_012816 [Coilia grayii]|uniref:Fibronectin type III domain-containing protein 10 n=1 Tax=Coilia grayii TaxID=363190 RepID=A0ABD1JUL9_9TELE